MNVNYMVSHSSSFAFSGIDVTDVDVQVNITSGKVAFVIVGLADKAVGESSERVKSALSAIGLGLPTKRIVVNLSPADLIKEGNHYDLPIALAVLAAMQAIPADSLSQFFSLGELALDGSITHVNGVLPAAIGANARNKGIICPASCGQEAAWAGDLPILAASHLLELVNHFKGTQLLSQPTIQTVQPETNYPDLIDIKGQPLAKRALEITAAGGHNLLMSGPPGSGKSMLASRLPSILPPMNTREMLECSMINSVAGKLKDGQIQFQRPFRDPHHSCSMAAMTGGGRNAIPGEITLAHNGVLFLDELPEFPKNVVDALRQPIETNNISIARVHAHVTYPAKFQFIAAMNPCRCGHLDDPARACSKAPRCGIDYQAKISGPIFDRMDIFVEVPAINPKDITQRDGQGETSEIVARRVLAARQQQAARYEGYGIFTNAEADGDVLIEAAFPKDNGADLLNQAVDQLGLSMRGYNRTLRVARTIADLEHSQNVRHHHIAEALSFRPHVHSMVSA